MSTHSMKRRAEDYLARRRSLGAALLMQGHLLQCFARYADRKGHNVPVTTELAVEWATQPKGATRFHQASRLGIVRRFAKDQSGFDPRTEIPPPGLLGSSYRRLSPHIYSMEEIAELMREAAALMPTDNLRPKTYTTLFGLLVSTGIRISEALRLSKQEADLDSGVLTISRAKFQKSRLVPLHPSTTKALRGYAAWRDRHCPLVDSTAFFVSDGGFPLRYKEVLSTFDKLRRRLGWKRNQNQKLPRIYDLRHTFACQRLLAWYREGDEMEAVIAAPNRSTWSGRRDNLMFVTFYNTGARVSEIVRLCVGDAQLDRNHCLLIHGKGRKERTVPLWKSTATSLRQWVVKLNSTPESPLFPNRDGSPLSRSGVFKRLKAAVEVAARRCPSLKCRIVSPHTLRHTTAMHLLQSDVDISVIALWLGHEDPATTHLHIEADLTMKEHALKKLAEPPAKKGRYRPTDRLIAFLEGL